MNFQEIKDEVVNGLKNRKVRVSIGFSDNNDENFKKYSFGEITLIDFVKNITEDSPYTISETFENNYVIHNKGSQLPIQFYINPKTLSTILSEENKLKFIKVYPELEDFIKQTYIEINSAECTACTRNGKSHRVVQEMLAQDNLSRDLSPLVEIFGFNFIEKIKVTPPIKRPPIPNNQNKQVESQSTLSNISTGFNSPPRPPCVDCCLKHLGKAVAQLEETRNGYPHHRWLAVGNIDEATAEIFGLDESIAKELREIRHLLIKDSDNDHRPYEMIETLHKIFKEN